MKQSRNKKAIVIAVMSALAAISAAAQVQSNSNTVTNNGTTGQYDSYYGPNYTRTLNGYYNNGSVISGDIGINNLGGFSINTLSNNGGALIVGVQEGVFNALGSDFETIINKPDANITSSGDGTDCTLARYHCGTGIYNEGAIGTLINDGTIGSAGGDTGSGYGIYNDVDPKGVINTLSNSGVIGGTLEGIWNSGNIDELDNTVGALIISNKGAAIFNIGMIAKLNNAGGTIVSSNNIAIHNSGNIEDLFNSGSISGRATAIYNEGGKIGILKNTGLIKSLGTGIVNRGVISVINNGGAIEASVAIDDEASIGTLVNTGVVLGNININSNSNLSIVGGTSPFFGSNTIFGTLTGCGYDPDNPCDYETIVGTLSAPNADIYLSGNIVLNDNVTAKTVQLSGVGALALLQAITITGDYHQSAEATLLSEVNSGDSYGQLVVNGTATIDSKARISLQSTDAASYALAKGQRYVIVNAMVGSTYNEKTLIFNLYDADGGTLSGLTASGQNVSAGNGAELELTLAGRDSALGSYPPAATSTNAAAALGGLTSYTGVDNAALLNIYNAAQALYLEVTDAINESGNKLTPIAQTGSMRAAVSPTYDTMRVIGAHQDGQRLSNAVAKTGVSSGEAEASNAVWGQAFGGHAGQNERNDVAGYSANFGGLILGADKKIDDRWRAGGAFSYSNTAVNSSDDLSGDTARVNGYGLFGYASYVAPKWYANVSAGAVYQHYKQSRDVEILGVSGTPTASFGGSQFVARGEVGYPLALGSATLTPIASLTYAYLRQNGYTESGGNGFALTVDAAHATSVQSDLGAKIERAYTSHYGVLIPSMQLAWRHEYNHQKTAVASQFAADPLGQTRFTTEGATPVSDTGVLSAGLTLLRANNLSVTAQYTLQAGLGYVSQAGAVKFRQLF